MGAAGLPDWFAAKPALTSPRGGGQLGEEDLRAGRYGVIRSLLVQPLQKHMSGRGRACLGMLSVQACSGNMSPGCDNKRLTGAHA